METKDLQARYNDAIELSKTMASDGWKVIDRELDSIYAESLSKLIAKEDSEARGILQGVNQLRNRIKAILSKGKLALEELNKNQKGD